MGWVLTRTVMSSRNCGWASPDDSTLTATRSSLVSGTHSRWTLSPRRKVPALLVGDLADGLIVTPQALLLDPPDQGMAVGACVPATLNRQAESSGELVAKPPVARRLGRPLQLDIEAQVIGPLCQAEGLGDAHPLDEGGKPDDVFLFVVNGTLLDLPDGVAELIA